MEKNEKVTKPKQKKRKKGRKILKYTFLTIISLILIGILAVGGVVGYIYYKNKVKISECIKDGYLKTSNINENTFNSRRSTKVLDKNGTLLKEFKISDYKYTEYDKINPLVFQAVIAIEDERFYGHKGIDYQGIMRAGAKIIASKGKTIQGGSSITQQLVKNTFLTNEQTMWRKLEEMVIAQELEKSYSKENILEFYVNNNYFGYGCYGIETASDYFFQKPTKDLTLSQITLLIGVPNNPTIYDPIKNPDNVLNRRKLILNKMFELKYITQSELDDALNEPITLNVKKVTYDNTIKEYDLSFAMQKATENYMKYMGFQFRYSFSNIDERNKYYNSYDEYYKNANEELMSGGYTIETAIDKEKQDNLQSIVDNELKDEYSVNPQNGLYMRQASATVIDNETGNVVAIVGGKTQNGNIFNRASLGVRQPGSAIKPLISYTPAFERGYTPDKVMEDAPINNGPSNWFNGYYGDVTIRYAIETSLNTIAYNVLNQIGAQNGVKYLTNMHYKYILPQDNTPIMAIGGFTKGTTTTEMAGGFSTLARNGEFIEPTNVLKITKIGTEEVIYENKHIKAKIYDAGASYMMTDVLRGVLNESYATGAHAKMNNFTNQAGKTGSTDDYKDIWMSGYTPYYTTVVWSGNDSPSPLYTSMSASKNIWKYMMEYLHNGLEDKDFKKPENVYYDGDKIKITINTNQENKVVTERKALEKQRTKAEINEQDERLTELAYRIKFGLTDEEEKNREFKAESLINDLKNYQITDLTQVIELNQKYTETSTAIYDVKRKSSYDNLLTDYKSVKYDLTIKQEGLESIERTKKEEEERAKKEEEERIKKEEEEKVKKEEEKKVKDNAQYGDTKNSDNIVSKPSKNDSVKNKDITTNTDDNKVDKNNNSDNSNNVNPNSSTNTNTQTPKDVITEDENNVNVSNNTQSIKKQN